MVRGWSIADLLGVVLKKEEDKGREVKVPRYKIKKAANQNAIQASYGI
jgi:hypothetical protein